MGWTNELRGQLRPPLRRGHSCVQHGLFAIIYGGINTQLLGDLWVLDCGMKAFFLLTCLRGVTYGFG